MEGKGLLFDPPGADEADLMMQLLMILMMHILLNFFVVLRVKEVEKGGEGRCEGEE